uniref:Uncharacterized protein n=1 Tax=Anguilla anguilla TaxID=7936 RepID=A0A0E9WBM3_ANGAN
MLSQEAKQQGSFVITCHPYTAKVSGLSESPSHSASEGSSTGHAHHCISGKQNREDTPTTASEPCFLLLPQLFPLCKCRSMCSSVQAYLLLLQYPGGHSLLPQKDRNQSSDCSLMVPL